MFQTATHWIIRMLNPHLPPLHTLDTHPQLPYLQSFHAETLTILDQHASQQEPGADCTPGCTNRDPGFTKACRR